MNRYIIRTAFVFEGSFLVTAETKEQAKQIVTEDCGLVMGGSIHSTLSDTDINWDFCMHPEKVIRKVKLVKGFKGKRTV